MAIHVSTLLRDIREIAGGFPKRTVQQIDISGLPEDAPELELAKLLDQYRDKGQYDCIVPFSGGKDSTFTLHYLMKEFKIKPLVVQFNHGFMRQGLLKNNERTFRKLGVDFVSFTPNWHLVKRLMLEALRRKGDFCWHCHTGIDSYPMHVALQHKVPLLFWGELNWHRCCARCRRE